ncbi:Six-hairpin glycosidase-like protein [Aspergillus lucknowensis]|uniref:Six-hairpin glycosidase-like protein n=1 Tax=Aspergillus lucknowensis TaxID=176173 RepID=A0ABR4LKJ2_9EURO
MRHLWTALRVLLALLAGVSNSEVIVYPRYYQQSRRHRELYKNGSTCVTLSPSSPVVTLDYETEVGGYPFLHATSLSGPVQVEAKYSEARDGLDAPYGDGPWVFSNGLSNSFRVETFNITQPGSVESFFQQGGQRWQSLRLLNGDRSVRMCSVGIRSLNDRTPVKELPGYFESSNPLYNEIWSLGPRTVQQACIAKGAAPTTWEVTPLGVLLRGQQSAQSALGTEYANYTLAFDTKIVRGGTGWRVATSINGYGLSLSLSSNYPAQSTLLNTNRSLLPPNTLAVGYGWNLVNQTSLTSGRVSYFPLSLDVKENEWMRIATSIEETGYRIFINDQPSITIPLSELQIIPEQRFGTDNVYTGTWGFGPYQDQIAYVKNVEVRARNGTILYHNAMTSESILGEYGIMDNQESVCLDGAKRDRLVWSGDFVHTHRIVSASTGRVDFIKGTLRYILDRQESSGPMAGLFTMSPAMGQPTEYTSIYKAYGLLDYQMHILNSFARYYLESADERFLQQYWPKVKTGVEAILPLVDSSTGLASLSIPGVFFLGDENGTAASALFAYTMDRMAKLAEIMEESDAAAHWSDVARGLSLAINKQLWNSELGTYSSSLASPNATSFIGTAWAILSNTPNTSQAASSIRALSSLRLGIGYKLTSDVSDSDPSTNISPNLSGFLLEALFAYSRDNPYNNSHSEAVDVLLNGLWAAMVTQDEYYSGTSWEYVYPDGRPGLDLFTSHAHPWGGAPTYVFTEYILGIQPTAPGFTKWSFRPTLAHTGLNWAKGRVPTPHGTIEASWKVERNGRVVSTTACSPKGTWGTLSLPLAARECRLNDTVVTRNCDRDGVLIPIEDGKCSVISILLSRPVSTST